MSGWENERNPRPGGEDTDNKGHASRNPLALAFATIERPQVAQRLIASARRRFPTMPIYVADQSLDVAAMSSIYTHMNVTLIRMPYDAGVCASRNRLAASIAEEYFVLCDDDFVMGARTDFGEALRILQHHPEIGVVGGKLYDYNGSVEKTRHWELFLHLDPVNRTLTATPIFCYAPRARVMGSTRFYMCDAVMNFAVMRRSIFDQPAIRWDERFKSNGEHEDFYLNMKLNSSVRVAYLPTMVAYHHHPMGFVAYRSRLRNRLEGWKQMFAKWNIDQHLEVGLEVRTVDDFNSVVAIEEVKARFFLNANLSLRRQTRAAALVIGQGASLSTVGMLNKEGEPNAGLPAMARLLVRAAGGRVMTGPDVEPLRQEAKQLEVSSQETPPSRYSFVPHGPVLEPGQIRSEILFRYNAIERSDADFLLWYRVAPPERAQAQAAVLASGTCVIHLRWFADDSRVLMWESTPDLLDLCRTDYWVPLLVEVPVCPSGCAFMRFEVVAGESAVRRPLATGFLFSHPSSESAVAQGVPPALDVLALTPWTFPEGQTLLPAASLDECGRAASAQRLTSRLCAEAPAMMLLPISGLNELDAVFLFGWVGLGAPMLVIRVPDRGVSSADTSAPTQVALPRLAMQSVRIVGFIKDQGYREVQLSMDHVSGGGAKRPPGVTPQSPRTTLIT